MNARSLKLWLHLFALLSVTACGGNAGAPNQPPTASFTATPSEGAAPLEVLFDASASADPDGSITAYAWDFRDGNAGAGRTTRHTFTAPGNYEVKLTVTDDGGKTGETTRTVAVTASNGNDGDNRAPLARDDLAVTNWR
ncbi:MAG: PKD domain-containing protein [Deinococcota bacterium]|nr:PKD domain-containing protein [Deinococcota bacterium]MDQ3458789.1 PKD domain-containing protein [Deinococcota bacterium]